ncbi:hypothetical protein FRC12_002205 [Ceratobasidium sp. 428]|nr:hypothetical protein FRC12_002205 [Ceratobasidium sp. 428]
MALYGTPLDERAIIYTLQSGGIRNIIHLSDETATKDNVLANLLEFSAGRPSVVYLLGHYEPLPRDVQVRKKFWTHDCYKKPEHRGPSRGVSAERIYQLLSEPDISRACLVSFFFQKRPKIPLAYNRAPRQFLTDFCYADNINRLRYKLEIIEGVPSWSELNEGIERNSQDMILHFAACKVNERAYETKQGGFFTQSLCEVIDTPMPLPDLLATVRKGVQNLIKDADFGPEEHNPCQTPQIYSSHPLDLKDTSILEKFGLFYRPVTCSPQNNSHFRFWFY